MTALSLDNPVFAAYAIAAAIMILKMASMSWLTVYRMMRIKGGFRNPEDANPGLANKQAAAFPARHGRLRRAHPRRAQPSGRSAR
jgi:hypothetical protein